MVCPQELVPYALLGKCPVALMVNPDLVRASFFHNGAMPTELPDPKMLWAGLNSAGTQANTVSVEKDNHPLSPLPKLPLSALLYVLIKCIEALILRKLRLCGLPLQFTYTQLN